MLSYCRLWLWIEGNFWQPIKLFSSTKGWARIFPFASESLRRGWDIHKVFRRIFKTRDDPFHKYFFLCWRFPPWCRYIQCTSHSLPKFMILLSAATVSLELMGPFNIYNKTLYSYWNLSFISFSYSSISWLPIFVNLQHIDSHWVPF